MNPEELKWLQQITQRMASHLGHEKSLYGMTLDGKRWGDSADYLYYPTLPLEEFTLHDCLDTLEEIHDSLRGDA
tara:strand:+ start:668 stop:889 length:222 start_codon:yes stop_codon:yes gene_type:complete